MRHRLAGAILRLYPRPVRERYGQEILALLDDLVAHDGRSRTGQLLRLAVDGLLQRITSTATIWTAAAVLAAASAGDLAVTDFAAANARQIRPRTVHTHAPPRHTPASRLVGPLNLSPAFEWRRSEIPALDRCDARHRDSP